MSDKKLSTFERIMKDPVRKKNFKKKYKKFLDEIERIAEIITTGEGQGRCRKLKK